MSKITINNQEYKLDDLSEKARSYAEHCHDLQKKIVNVQKDLEQLVTAKNTYYNALKQELEAPQAAE
jgi:uncharacterized protein YlxW (UPF0749 family)